MALTREKLIEDIIAKFLDKGDEPDVLKANSECIAYILDNCEITIPQENTYFGRINSESILKDDLFPLRRPAVRQKMIDAGLLAGQKVWAHIGNYDFGHTNAEWQTIFSLGIPGLRDRAVRFLARPENDASQKRFYENVIFVYDAAIRFMLRMAENADKAGKPQMAQGLRNLTEKAPQNLFEAMQLSILWYHLQSVTECTILRTLGRLDKLYFPFWVMEDREKAADMIREFLLEIDRLDAPANMPYAVGGTDDHGHDQINELSYEFLRLYKELAPPRVKFHILVTDNTPVDYIASAMDGIRSGCNSIVFMSDSKIIESLEKIGIEHEDAVNYHVVGCYECGGEGEIASTCNGRISIPKALEYALNDGIDVLTGYQVGLPVENEIRTFEDLMTEFRRQLAWLCRRSIQATNIFEAGYAELHAAPFLSSTYTHAMEQGKDVYCGYGAKYNNSSINGIGIATAADALYALKKIVFEEKRFTLEQFNNILLSDWEGQEALRLTIKNKFPKFGQNDEQVDSIAADISRTLAKNISGVPNVKGGVYRLGLLSIDWRWKAGAKTPATADGRRSGETFSQNASAAFGADKEGATAHLLSAAKLDASNTPNATIIDIDLHSSAVRGENGLNSMVSALLTFFKAGGFSVHYNVLDTETLKKAKENPEAYPNLQVRLCGWNELFNSLTEKEKDDFIARSMA